jgi:hypothetical protein
LHQKFGKQDFLDCSGPKGIEFELLGGFGEGVKSLAAYKYLAM